MKNLPAIINLVSGIIFSVLFLLMILYFVFNFKKRYNNSISDGIFQFGYFAAFYPILAFIAFQKSSDSSNHLAVDDITLALIAVLSTAWAVYAFFRLSRNVEK